jgi:NAD(P)-dependent dehydrogenase (short-subunit alcohol dehydrogenase family)
VTTQQTALVIGGTSGIGLATAQQLADGGHTVHVASRNAQKVAAVREIAPKIIPHELDANDEPAVAALATALAPIHVLVITLGGSEGMGTLADLDLAGLRRAFDAKLWPTLTALQTALPHLAEQASITLVGAISAQAAMPGTAGIGALNAAIEALVGPLAVELAPRRVNAVSPGLVDTPWWNTMPEESKREWFATAEEALPSRHVSTPEEIAQVIALLASNPTMTGTIVQADGGARLIQL